MRARLCLQGRGGLISFGGTMHARLGRNVSWAGKQAEVLHR